MTPLTRACASWFGALAARLGRMPLMQSRGPLTRNGTSRGDMQVGAGDLRLLINEGPFSR